MVNWIPWGEVRAELMKNPEISKNYDEEYAAFEKEIEAQLAAERVHTERRSPLPVALARTTTKRKPRAFSTKLKRTRATA